MKILLLGATGRTGRILLREALDRGHDVHLAVRDAGKLGIQRSSLKIWEGTPLDKDVLKEAMQGCEAVLNVLNVSRRNDFPWAPLRTPKDFLSSVMKNIIELSGSLSIRRIIFTSAWGVAETAADIPGWFRWMIRNSNIGPAYADHERQELLVQATDLDWTSVRPVGLTNGSGNKSIIVTRFNQPKPRLTISRRSVARFMLDVLEKGMYVREKVVISE